MPATPGFTLTALLQDIAGGAVPGGRLKLTLCGFDLGDPAVVGISVMSEIEKTCIPDNTGLITQLLWGNDVISPAGTFYCAQIIDSKKNIVWAQNFQFNGAGGNLSVLTPYIPTPPVGPGMLAYLPCAGAVPGTNYTAPGTVIAVTYNGTPQRPGIDYTLPSPTNIALNFSTVLGDKIYALCIVPTSMARNQYVVCAGAFPGTIYVAPKSPIAVTYNGTFQRPFIDYTPVGTFIILNFSTVLGDSIYALV